MCRGAVESVLRAVRLSEALGLTSEIICVIDNGDENTLKCITRYEQFVKIFECSFGDLSLARNFGAVKACGRFVTFIDGDDLWGNEWVTRCVTTMTARQNAKLVLHPQVNLYFGDGMPSSIWVHPNVSTGDVDLLDVFISNRWTASCFAHREVFLNCPYTSNQIDKGFGYEDWLWHIRTILEGYEHSFCPKTCHFIRRKETGSLLKQTNRRKSLPNLNDACDLSELRRRLLEIIEKERPLTPYHKPAHK